MSVLHWPTPIDETLLLAISRANPGQFELTADGTLVLTPPTGTTGSLGESLLHEQVLAWQRTYDPNGFTLPASGGITLPDGGTWSGDTTYISASTYDSASDEDLARAFWRLVPDAIFEPLSDSDRITSDEFTRKLEAYTANALPLVVILDPKGRRSLTSRDAGPLTESFDLLLDLSSHLPGFTLDAGAIFEQATRTQRRRREPDHES
jgi:Uma2 family endonuclease